MATQLGCALSNLSSRMGEHYTYLATLAGNVEKLKPENILPVAERLNLLVKHRKELKPYDDEIHATIETWGSFVVPLSKAEQYSSECEKFGDNIVSSLLSRVDSQFEKAINALATYRNTRRQADWVNFCCAARDLKSWTQAMRTDRQNFVTVSQWEFTQEQLNELGSLQRAARELHEMTLTVNTVEVAFLRTLDSLLEGNPSSADVDVVHRSFQTLTDEAKTLLDLVLGKENRFEDLQRFRTAYLQMIRTYWKTHHIYLSDDNKKGRFCKELHGYAYGPNKTERKAWVEKELPYLIGLIPAVDSTVHHKLGQIATSKGNKNAPNPVPQTLTVFRRPTTP